MDVVHSSDLANAEKKSFKKYGDKLAEQFMEKAGRLIAEEVLALLKPRHQQAGHKRDILLVCGSGNNAGDAYVCGRFLLGKGVKVRAVQLAPGGREGSLWAVQSARFERAGGKIYRYSDGSLPWVENAPLIIDGILGTGFRGELRESCRHLIQAVNESGLPVVAIDLPSGLDGDGLRIAVEGECVKSDLTLFLGRPKTGAFLWQNLAFVGRYNTLDFGLQPEFLETITVRGDLQSQGDLAALLPEVKRCRHKYQAGLVCGFAGSLGMGGAARLAATAALKSGCGMMRLMCYGEILPELQGALPEIVLQAAACAAGDIKNDDAPLVRKISESWEFPSSGSAGAGFIGPGLGRSNLSESLCRELAETAECPLVLDADALHFHAEKPFRLKKPENTVLTPHTGELKKLLARDQPVRVSPEEIQDCQGYVERTKVTLVLKGAVTMVFSPDTPPAFLCFGNPGMATAGAGDVLTGMIAGFLAQGLSSREAAILGAGIHGIAGSIAARKRSPYCLTASDLITELPEAITGLLSLKMGSGYEGHVL